jgi:hypothetical protein
MDCDFEPFRVKRKKRVKQKLHKQKRRNVYAGNLYTKKDLPRPRPTIWYVEINMASYGAAIASTKTHKRNNKH